MFLQNVSKPFPLPYDIKYSKEKTQKLDVPFLSLHHSLIIRAKIIS